MCVKLFPENLNPGSYLSHPKSTYTCRVTIAPKVCGGSRNISNIGLIFDMSIKESIEYN